MAWFSSCTHSSADSCNSFTDCCSLGVRVSCCFRRSPITAWTSCEEPSRDGRDIQSNSHANCALPFPSGNARAGASRTALQRARELATACKKRNCAGRPHMTYANDYENNSRPGGRFRRSGRRTRASVCAQRLDDLEMVLGVARVGFCRLERRRARARGELAIPLEFGLRARQRRPLDRFRSAGRTPRTAPDSQPRSARRFENESGLGPARANRMGRRRAALDRASRPRRAQRRCRAAAAARRAGCDARAAARSPRSRATRSASAARASTPRQPIAPRTNSSRSSRTSCARR